MVEYIVKQGDVREEPSDLLLLKYAQGFYAADGAIATRLVSANICTEDELRPRPGHFVVIDTKGCVAPKRAMFLGTPPIRSFSYNEMEVFARRAIGKIADLGLEIRVLTTTVHGLGYGLDSGEALERLVRGFREEISKQRLAITEKIIFLTLVDREARLLDGALDVIRRTATTPQGQRVETGSYHGGFREHGASGASDVISVSSGELIVSKTSVAKRRVFVALPFSEDFQNVYEFGIYPAVRNCGFVCERVDEQHFAGDVLARIKGGIEAADLVIADLSEGRPNVYLEVGYAWGRGVPVVFVAKKGEQLHFDVSTHRCIFYSKYSQFAKDLEQLIRGLVTAGGSEH